MKNILKILIILQILVQTNCTEIPDDLGEPLKGCDSVFDSATHFCYDGNVYALCGSVSYNPTTHICEGNVANPARCGGSQYNPLEQICLGSVVETKCGNDWYNAANTNLRCQNGVVETKCGTGWYDDENANLRCQSNVVEANCGSDRYNANWYDVANANLRCWGGTVETKCGTAWYNSANQRCGTNNVIEAQCGTAWYNTTNQRCRASNIVETRCGTVSDLDGVLYSLDGIIYLYGNAYYNPATEQCCGNGKYTTATQICQSGIVVTKCGADIPGETQYCKNGTTLTQYGSITDGAGQEYKTVIIGEQTWMAENLDYAVEGSKCYDNDPANCAKYGRLYDWATAMELPSDCNLNTCFPLIQTKHRGICPEGWHIPSQADWNTLVSFIESDKSCNNCAAKHLKTTIGGKIPFQGEDSYGFAALPGGQATPAFENFNGSFNNEGYSGHWWSSNDQFEPEYEYEYYVSTHSNFAYSGEMYATDGVYWDYSYKMHLFSVRCVKD